MKLTILKDNLKKGLNYVEKVTGKNLSLPILSNILLKTDKNFLYLAGTDLEIAIQYWSLAKIEKEGNIVVPGKILSTFISFLKDQKINISSKKDILIIETNKNKTQIKGFNPDEFPIIPQIQSPYFIEISPKKFIEGLNQVVEIVSISQMRPEITGLLLVFSKEGIKIVGTDSFRLAEKKICISTKLNSEKKCILPKKTAKELISSFTDRKQKIKICFTENQIMFESRMEELEHPEIQIISRLIDGEYPNYQGVIPKSFSTQILVEKEEFIRYLKTASLFVDRNNEIKLIIEPKNKEVEIKVQNPEVGENISYLPAEIKGEKLEISFNWKFLLDGLMNIKSNQVVIKFNGDEGPALMESSGEEKDYIYIVMPIKPT